MSWAKLQAEKRVAAEPTSKTELVELRTMVASNLKDAQVNELSGQGRYEFAYNAARLMSTIAIRASGYRVIAKNGYHYFTFQALQAVHPSFEKIGKYFDKARRRRNDFSYASPIMISDTDAEDLVKEVSQFIEDSEKWIAGHDKTLAK
jgi:hypothetical protein